MKPNMGCLKLSLTLPLLTLLLISGCAMQARRNAQPIVLFEPASWQPGQVAVIRSGASRRDTLLERINWATVTKIDGLEIKDRSGLDAPIIVRPGSVTVTIRFDKDSFLCGTYAGGCIPFKQSERSLSLLAEPGHSYMPQTKKYCGKDWIWIEDLGIRAENELMFWKEHHSYPLAKTVNRVVAGDAPPASCDMTGSE